MKQGRTQVEVEGAVMRVRTTMRMWLVMGPALIALGAAMVVYAYRAAVGQAVSLFGLGGIGMVGGGAYITFLRRGLVLDSQTRRITMWWRWLALRGSRSVDAAGRNFAVERSTSRHDTGNIDVFRIVVGDDVLHEVSEHTGGSDLAVGLAKQMARHLGVAFEGERECKKQRRRREMAAKYAWAPVAVVGACLLVAAIVFLLTAKR